MFCPRCGNAQPYVAWFCFNCGTRLPALQAASRDVDEPRPIEEEQWQPPSPAHSEEAPAGVATADSLPAPTTEAKLELRDRTAASPAPAGELRSSGRKTSSTPVPSSPPTPPGQDRSQSDLSEWTKELDRRARRGVDAIEALDRFQPPASSIGSSDSGVTSPSSPMAKVAKKAIVVVVGLVGLVLVVLVGEIGREAGNWLVSRPADPTLAVLNRVASELNKNLPMRIDQETELMNVGAREGVIVYNYRCLNFTASELNADTLVEELRPSALRQACTTPETADGLLKRGVAMRFSYVDRSRAFITAFDVTPENCGF